MVRKDGILSIGSVALAFLASQHHSLHMLMFSLGAGTAGMSFMTMYPTLRRLMLLLSVVMLGVTVFRTLPPGRPKAMRVMGAVSGLLTLALIGWSVYQFGL
jgi:hypothetical protein